MHALMVKWLWQWIFRISHKKWYVTHDQNGTDYGERNKNGTTVKFETKSIEPSLLDYSDAYILVTGDVTAKNGGENTYVAFKNFALFIRCITDINDEYTDNAGSLDITMSMIK